MLVIVVDPAVRSSDLNSAQVLGHLIPPVIPLIL